MPTHDFSDIGDVLGFELLRGTITAIDAATDTCTVTVGGKSVTALLFYHCAENSAIRASGAIEGAAQGFDVGDSVIVMKKHDDSVIKVIAHVYGIRKCRDTNAGKYFIFYSDGRTLNIAECTYGDAVTVLDTKTAAQVASANTVNPIMFHCKRFTHNVPAGGVTTARDLYFIATSLYINPEPFAGWTAFATANPAFALVTNNANTQIAMTDQLWADMNSVNADVNAAHAYVHDPAGNDNWHILTGNDPGDCEDFALTKAKALLDLGYPASAIHIEVGLYEGATVGHAWLVVQTTEGDYALDLNSNPVIRNSELTFSGTEFYSRRRQIGSNWAFISGFGWMMTSINQTTPNTLWYILDPVLNIFYILTPSTTLPAPFGYVADPSDATKLSSASINFSEDNNSIYLADGTNIEEYKLNENDLTLVSTMPYNVNGFVGRDGQIVEGEGLTGRQDPYNWGVETSDILVQAIDGIYHLSQIATSRLGDFRCLYNCDVVSENGYYSYDYQYLEGTFSHTGNEFLIEWSDPDRPDDECFHSRSVWDDPDHPISDDCVHKNNTQDSYSFMSKAQNDQSSYWFRELLDPLLYPVGHLRSTSDWAAYYSIYGEEIPYYTVDPIPEDYDNRADIPWTHIEINEVLLFRGIQFNRATDVGDNLRRMYKSGVSCVPELMAAVSCSEENLLGLVYIPQTDRLNN